METITLIKRLCLVTVVVALVSFWGVVLGSVEEWLEQLDLLNLQLGTWWPLAASCLVEMMAIVVAVPLFGALVRSTWWHGLTSLVAVLLAISIWQGGINRAVAFVTQPLGGGLLIFSTLALWRNMKKAADRVESSVKFSARSLALSWILPLVSLSLVFYLVANQQLRNINWEDPRLGEIVWGQIVRFVPTQELGKVPPQELANLKEQLVSQVLTHLRPWTKYLPGLIAISLFSWFKLLTIPLGWVCPYIAWSLLEFLKVVGIVKVKRGPIIVEWPDLEGGDFSGELGAFGKMKE